MEPKPMHPSSSRAFQRHQEHDLKHPSSEIIQYSKTFAPQVQKSWNQAHAPFLIQSFPKTPTTRSEASEFGGSHDYKTNQNKINYLPS